MALRTATGLGGRTIQPLAALLLAMLVFSTAAAAQSAGDMPYGRGLLWEVRQSDGPPSHVFGLPSSSHPDVAEIPRPVAEAFEASNRLVLEVVNSSAAEKRLELQMRLQDERGLYSVLGERRYNRAFEAASRYGFLKYALDLFSPFGLIFVFSLPPSEFDRVEIGEQTAQERLEDLADILDMRVASLATIDEVTQQYRILSEAQQLAVLDEILEFNVNIEAACAARREVYLDGDSSAMLALMTAASDDGEATLLAAVNERWVRTSVERMVRRLPRHLDGGGAFVAVTAELLPGKHGLLSRLAGEGYRIRRVY